MKNVIIIYMVRNVSVGSLWGFLIILVVRVIGEGDGGEGFSDFFIVGYFVKIFCSENEVVRRNDNYL